MSAISTTAEISPDGLYRYWLERHWGGCNTGHATFVMLNPSTADATSDDPTIRRCMGFARAWGLDGITVVNLYALRSTDPKGLWMADDPVGPSNDGWLEVAAHIAARQNAPTVAAWGASARADRVALVEATFQLFGAPLQSLGTTKAGQPRHPLYLPGTAQLQPWTSERAA